MNLFQIQRTPTHGQRQVIFGYPIAYLDSMEVSELFFVKPYAFLKDGIIEEFIFVGDKMRVSVSELDNDIHVDTKRVIFVGEHLFQAVRQFMAAAQDTLVCAFGLGTGAFAIWLDTTKTGRDAVRIRHYDARMIIPLSWDMEGVTEGAFVTRAFYKGEAIDQLQIHSMGDGGTFRIKTVCFDSQGNEFAPEGILDDVDTVAALPPSPS